MPNLSSHLLKKIMLSTLKELEVSDLSAQHVVESIVSTSLRGTDSHGINLFPHYWQVLKIGRVNKHPKFQFDRKSASLALLEADFALGHHAGAAAMDHVCEMAEETGAAFVSVKNSTHFGAAAYFGLMPAKRGMIGFSFTNADSLVKVHNAKAAFFGTNPICITAPLRDEDPLCLDMATSTVSWNKIRNHRSVNKPLESGWAHNEAGHSETDPHKATSLSPSGSYKGFGLGMFVEIFCGLLASGPIGEEIGPMFTQLERKRSISHFFGAINLGVLLKTEDFKARLQTMVNAIRQMPGIDGDAVMVPGDPEKKMLLKRLETGIPIETEKLNEFIKINSEFKQAIL